MIDPASLWRAAQQQPLTWVFVTLAVYQLAIVLNRKTGGHALANPVGLGALLLIGVLLATGTDYKQYFEGGKFIQMLLGPATVALAVPLYANLHRLSKVFWPLLISLLLGSLVGIVSSAGVAWALGLDDILIKSLLSRSVSTPISMGIASEIGGAPELAAVFVIVSGVFGAMLGWPLLSRLRLGQDVVYGFATGMAAHGIGTARAFQRSDTAGAFSGLAMGLNGLVTAILIPLLLRFWH